MKIGNRQYPHPVLASYNDDYPGRTFTVSLDNETTWDSYKIKGSFKSDCKDLLKLIEEKKAYFALHVECPETRYRKMITCYRDDFEFDIHADDVNGKVELCAFILAGEDIEQFSSTDFYPDYKGCSFMIKEGDILASGDNLSFFAEKELDLLKKINSIFSVKRNPVDNPPPYEIDINGNKVLILLSPDNYNSYGNLKAAQNLHLLLASLIVIPALVSLLEMIKAVEGREQYENFRWYRVLERRLKKLGIEIDGFTDSAVTVAQKVIGNPLTGSFKILEEYESGDLGGEI